MPVKTRETMGGGHSSLFTRDIAKAMSTAKQFGYLVLPVVIAESWRQDLSILGCPDYIHLDINPNQITALEPRLRDRLIDHIDVFESLCLERPQKRNGAGKPAPSVT